jgi:hypothetical protein
MYSLDYKCSSFIHQYRKLIFPWCLTKNQAMQTYGGVEVQLHVLLTSGLEGGEWSASRLGHFTHKEITLLPTGYKADWNPQEL